MGRYAGTANVHAVRLSQVRAKPHFVSAWLLPIPTDLRHFRRKKIVYGERPIGSLEKFYSYIQHHTALGQVYSGSVL